MGPRMGIRGKREAAAEPSDGEAVASMGPRMGIRGKPTTTVAPSSRFPLQWGRGWGSAERAKALRYMPVRAKASMGPRMGIRGKSLENGLSDMSLYEASMGPRMGIRGKPDAPRRNPRNRRRLQWGRGWGSAERPGT